MQSKQNHQKVRKGGSPESGWHHPTAKSGGEQGYESVWAYYLSIDFLNSSKTREDFNKAWTREQVKYK